ncbi:MAG TPA: rhomboid family intramembrane serine protease [Terriglobia bacterium]|nr:rhomboid family intramembrane serine protease [Terriglobia bacterium]
MIPIPINDNVRRRTFWTITLLLIAANTWAFLYELSLGHLLNRFIFVFGVVPGRYMTAQGLAIPGFLALFVPLFVSMFLHGGWLHLIGNMLFLFVFGRSLEDRFGHGKFLILYFLSGLGAAFLHIYLNAGSPVPSIGASGAIAGVLGAYFVCFPRARITTVIFLIFFFWTVQLPALLVLGYWFLVQFVAGYQMLAIQSATGGGVAWWAHVGGFLTGLILALVFQPRRAKVEMIRPY